jgi:hypothetical protein
MSKLAAGYFNKTVTNKEAGINWPHRSVALIPFQKSDKRLMELIDQKVIQVKPIEKYFADFKVGDNSGRLFTHIGSGIGDIIALSAITNYLSGYPIQVHAPRNKHVIFQWFKEPVEVRDYFAQIVEDFTPKNRILKYKRMHRIVIENAAIEAHDKNWIEAHFNRIGLKDVPEEFCRPQLRTDRINEQPSLFRPGPNVLICHRASCQMRSSNLVDFYNPVRKVLPDYDIYVHEVDLTDSDKRFIEKTGNIFILPKSDLHDYLINLFDADMVVTTDTGGLHFREGVERPSLGVFGAMTTGSRTSGYRFTKSFNVKSTCEHQPCFIHELIKGQVCLNAKEGDRTAKCQSGKAFQNQLESELLNFLADSQ